MSSTLVIVPTYNEAENLPVVAARLLALGEPLDVLCVDDASPDGTGSIGDRLARKDDRFNILHRQGPRGYSRASIAGMRWALDRGYQTICTMDADQSHDASDVPRLLEAVRAGADVAIGSRYVEGGELIADWGWMRRAISHSGSEYARAMLGTEVHDCTAGFRCYRAETLREVLLDSLRSEGYSFLIEMLALLLAQGAIVVEVPVRYVERQMGASKISRAIVLEALLVTTRLGARRMLGGSRSAESHGR